MTKLGFKTTASGISRSNIAVLHFLATKLIPHEEKNYSLFSFFKLCRRLAGNGLTYIPKGAFAGLFSLKVL